MPDTIPELRGPCAALFAHPGHELVILGLVERMKPLVAVLTDGSGNTGKSRIDSTTRVLAEADAEPSSFYAKYGDQDCYRALLAHDHDAFVQMSEELAAVLLDAGIETVAGDAAEGWNPIHDVWRIVINTAVALAGRRCGRKIQNLEFPLFESHAAAAAKGEPAVLVRLKQVEFERKLAAGHSYPELHAEVLVAMRGTTAGMIPWPELSAEVDRRLGGLNPESYRVEMLRPVSTIGTPESPPLYELYGNMRVASGRYREAITYAHHLAPVEAALRRHTERQMESSGVCASYSPRTT